MNTLGVAEGPHNWNLTVRYHDAEQIREQSLQVSATIVTEVSIQPTALNIFTQSAKSHELTLTDLRPEPLQISHVEVTSPYLRTEGGPFVKNAAGHYCSKIAVHMSDDCPSGRYEEFLVVHTSDTLYREIKIPITIVKNVRQRVTATPTQVTLNAPRFVRLRDTQDEPVSIESVKSDHSRVVCTWAAGPDNQATVKLVLAARQPGDDSTKATVRVQLSSPVREVLTIPAEWDLSKK